MNLENGEDEVVVDSVELRGIKLIIINKPLI